MHFKTKLKYYKLYYFIMFLSIIDCDCYEKTLRKIVRNQSKMVQRPFSQSSPDIHWGNSSQPTSHTFLYPGYAQVTSVIHKMQRPKLSTILSSIDTGRSKSMFTRMNIKGGEIRPYELRMTRDSLTNHLKKDENNFIFPDLPDAGLTDLINSSKLETNIVKTYSMPTSIFFPSIKEKYSQSKDIDPLTSDKIVYENSENFTMTENNNVTSSTEIPLSKEVIAQADSYNLTLTEYYDVDPKTPDFLSSKDTMFSVSGNKSFTLKSNPLPCTDFLEAKVDIDAQEKFSEFNIEPPWIVKEYFWNHIYDNRYEALMRDASWPPLKVILIPRSQVYSIWKQPFEKLHNETVHKIISNLIKKLKFYPKMTFSWNEVSHLSHWWKSSSLKSRRVLRRLVEEGRLEITTGGWVETDEATSHLFGILHQLIEGHQWLQFNLNYSPDVAWLTNSLTHSPTLPYLLSISGISNLVLTNLHFSWQRYLTEYQYTDFVWVQNWDTDKTVQTSLNEALNRIGNSRYPKYSVLVHYLQFNSADYNACGPQGNICGNESNYDDSNNQDINASNVKEKSERLLEQYSKTGTTSSHNVVIAPLGGPYRYKTQTEFDYQYNNYQNIIDFVNLNQDIYKATIEFGTSKSYFENILARRNSFSTAKGDFLNFADIADGSPVYLTGYFTTRPTLKILLRRLHSTLRSTEILFSFVLNFNPSKLFLFNVSELNESLLDARETVARLQDRNVVSGTLTARGLQYAYNIILKTVKDCWYLQEVAMSLLSSKSSQITTYLEKYVYKEGEFISSFKSVTPGDQLYIFNSLNHERSEIVEFVTRYPYIKIFDHSLKEVVIQINPVWKSTYSKGIKISSNFFRITFLVTIPPMTLQLFKIQNNKEGARTSANFATIYCMTCSIDEVDSGSSFPFVIRPIDTGDIQLESYNHKLIFDEYTGFLKKVTEKSTNYEKIVQIEFGALRRNISNPIEDILSPYRLGTKSKAVIIIAGQINTQLTTIYGTLLQHTVKIFNLVNNPLAEVIQLETNLDYDMSLKNKELEMFLLIQTNIDNGVPPELFIDNNGFQWTSRKVNNSRRIESNIYPFTTMAFIQDRKSRMTIITERAQGVTALQEGQLIITLSNKGFIYENKRESDEGIADNRAMHYTHYLLLENLIEPKNNDDVFTRANVKLPSQLAIFLSNGLDYVLDIYFIDNNKTHLCHYAFLPLIKTKFPCDIMLINYRVILNRETPAKYAPNTALMTLLRYRFCCFIKQSNYFLYCREDRPFRLDSMLWNVKMIYQTNLVGTNEGVTINYINNNNLPPMELTTLRLHF